MSDARINELIEQAFAYRGYVTVSRRDGSHVVGFIYDRGAEHVEMFDESATRRIRVALDDITDVALSGEDASAKATRSWERRRGSLESRDTSAWGDWEERPTLIVVALPVELRGVARVLGAKVRGDGAHGRLGDGRVIAHAVGMGGSAARVIAELRPRLVVSCGFSGALQPSLATGSLVLASSVCDENGESVIAEKAGLRVARNALEEYAPVAEGELLSATRVAATRAEKRALARPGRLAVDLESWSAVRAAERTGVPWLALRAVLDPLDAELPAFTREARASYVVAALRHALGGPRSALELVRVGLRADTAIRALQQALLHLAPALGRLGGQE